ncbi:MAG: sigma-70 family RNA polymerase sigma factor [Anaerolineae bacterium]|nr:sigma-70 family RNA polymerase sigma factor [Anaerolineae bacterium]
MEETVWIQRALEGDTRAFSRLVQVYQTPVYNVTYRMLGERMEAEDAAQETFLRAFRNLQRYDPKRPFRTWLLSIAAHHCIDRMRRQRPTLSLDDVVLRAAGDVEPERTVLERERQAGVQALLEALSPTDRMAVILMYWHDCSYEEVAEVLHLTVSAVKSRLHRARRAMAQALEEGVHGV